MNFSWQLAVMPHGNGGRRCQGIKVQHEQGWQSMFRVNRQCSPC